MKRKVGVGPHPQPWPDDDRYDPELLAQGDVRNVIDRYRYWSNEAIAADMRKRSAGLEIAIENWQHDFNIGSIVRTANAFNVSRVHIIGKRQWNKRGAMVTNRYLEIIYHPTVKNFVASLDDRQVIAVDNIEGSVALSSVLLPKKTVLVFGGEGPGLSADMLAASRQVVAIEQFGSTRSVNVGVAAGIVMYSWLQQHSL